MCRIHTHKELENVSEVHNIMSGVVSLETLLLRAEGSLSRFLNKAVVEVLEVINPESIKPSNLAELIVRTVDTSAMLQNVTTRNIIINAMRENEASEFAKFIGVERGDNVHYELMHKKFTKNVIGRALEFFGEKSNDRTFAMPPTRTEIKPQRQLFPHQLKTVEKVRAKLMQAPHRVLLHMPTGSGKTTSAMKVILIDLLERDSGLVIWLTHSEELCEQAMQEFQRVWKCAGDRSISAYRFFGRHDVDLLKVKKGFVVASLLKLLGTAKKDIKFLSEIAQKTRMVVIDEAHQATAPKFSIIIDELIKNKNARLLGLSATPGRKSDTVDPANIQLAQFFGNQKVVLDTGCENPIKFLIREKYLAKPKFNRIEYTGSNLTERDIESIKDDLDIPNFVLKKLSGNTVRNLKIVQEITRLAKAHKKIIVFAAEVEHAKSLSLILSAKQYNSCYITSNTHPDIRTEILTTYKNDNVSTILCNYGILTMGFDAPKTSAVVIARPTKSYVLYAQMVGRGIRGPHAGGNAKCEISTVADSEIDEFVKLTEIFTRWEAAWNE